MFELGVYCLLQSGMKIMRHSMFDLAVIVSAVCRSDILLGVIRHTDKHGMSACHVTRYGLLNCHSSGAFVSLLQAHPHLYVTDLNTLSIHLFLHNPEKKKTPNPQI